MGEAARGPLGDIREWGGVAWAKLGSLLLLEAMDGPGMVFIMRAGEWTVEVATEMRAATAAVPSQTQQLAEVSGLRWVGETPPAIAIAECEKAEGARAEGGERKRKREGCGL